MSKKPNKPDPKKLRDSAEKELGGRSVSKVRPSVNKEILHELSVHQIELEMQNEALRQSQLMLEESRDRYVDLYDFAPVGYLTLNAQGIITEINLTGAALLGQERKTLRQRRFAPLIATADRESWETFKAKVLKHSERLQTKITLNRGVDSTFYAQLDCLPVRSDGLTTVRIALTDITESTQKDESLREKEEFFRMIAENSDDFIAVLDLKGRRLYNNPTYARLFGNSEIKGTDSFAEIHPDDRVHVMRVFKETIESGFGMRTDFRFILADGSVREMESRGGLVKNSMGQPSRVVVVSRDITERKQAEEKIHKLDSYDLLTNLPNRRLLNDRLVQVMATSKRSKRFGALMFIDLDYLKPLNDQHGHSAGDSLLVEVARRISSCVREVDTVSRYGGDEFVVLLSDMDVDTDKSYAEAGVVAEKIRVVLAESYELTVVSDAAAQTTVSYHCSASIGVVMFSNHQFSTDEIMKRADFAMYRAKKNGGNTVRYSEPDTPLDMT